MFRSILSIFWVLVRDPLAQIRLCVDCRRALEPGTIRATEKGRYRDNRQFCGFCISGWTPSLAAEIASGMGTRLITEAGSREIARLPWPEDYRTVEAVTRRATSDSA